MKNNIPTVMNKEFARFFGDRRMVLMVLLLPGILIYAVYSFMGTALQSMFAPDDGPVTVYIAGLPESVRPLVSEAGFDIVIEVEAREAEEIKERISNRETGLFVMFPPDFDAQVEAYDVRASAEPAPNIEIFFNSVDPNSADSYRRMIMALDAFESALANKFDINRGIADADRATAEDSSASFISSMMPMLLLIFLYSGCISLAPESIAGEKERGTIATLLVTPLKRSELAIGKILSLAVLSFLSGLVSAVATILSLPNLIGGAGDINVNIYGTADYLWLALVILSTILLLVSAISIVSAYAKTVKEAGTAVAPLMVVVMLVGVTGMFGGGAQENMLYYIVPLYGSVQSMSGVFSLEYSAVNVAVSCLSSFIYACAGGVALTKMFNSEKIMFSK